MGCDRIAYSNCGRTKEACCAGCPAENISSQLRVTRSDILLLDGRCRDRIDSGEYCIEDAAIVKLISIISDCERTLGLPLF